MSSYRYDAAGRIDQQTDVGSACTQVANIGYDEAGQLTSYSGSAGSYTYSYDTNGNRRTMVEDGVSSSNTYAAGSNRILSSPTANYIYNADGSPSNNGNRTLGYNIYGRMTTMNMPSETITRTYDAMGLRVRSVSQLYISGGPLNLAAGAGGSTSSPAPSAPKTPALAAAGTWQTDSLRDFFHDDSGRLLGEYDSISGYTQETIWFAGLPVATRIGGVLHIIRADHLGTPRSIARASDNVEVWRWDSEPFGKTPVAAGSSITYNLRFPGQYYEYQTGYHYNWMRDYDPQTGRYVQADPIGLAGGLSRYGYVGGNPISRKDPKGLYWFQQIWQERDPLVGREGSSVEPGGGISNFIERYAPAGRTMAEIHDPLVGALTRAGVPDVIANVPTMLPSFVAGVALEILRSLCLERQPKPPKMCPQ